MFTVLEEKRYASIMTLPPLRQEKEEARNLMKREIILARNAIKRLQKEARFLGTNMDIQVRINNILFLSFMF